LIFDFRSAWAEAEEYKMNLFWLGLTRECMCLCYNYPEDGIRQIVELTQFTAAQILHLTVVLLSEDLLSERRIRWCWSVRFIGNLLLEHYLQGKGLVFLYN